MKVIKLSVDGLSCILTKLSKDLFRRLYILLKNSLGNLHRFLCQSIRLGVLRAGYDVVEIILFCKHGEILACVLRTIIRNNVLRDSKPTEYLLQLLYNSLAGSLVQLFDFKVSAEIVNNNEVLLVVSSKQICGYGFPWVIWNIMTY